MRPLQIFFPDSNRPERRYTARVILGEYLDRKYQIHYRSRTKEVQIKVQNGEGSLRLPDVFFPAWDEADSPGRICGSYPLPQCRLPVEVSPGTGRRLPVLFGRRLRNGAYYRNTSSATELGLDIFGAVFFLLTRLEERNSEGSRDEHDRFPAAQSVSFRYDFLDRPLVDEYVQVLDGCMSELWPENRSSDREYSVRLTHDVDRPLSVIGQPVARVVSRIGGDFFVRREPKLGVRKIGCLLRGLISGRSRRVSEDPNFSFDHLLDTAEEHGLVSEFYFATGTVPGDRDPTYRLDSDWLRKLLRKISDRGHRIGIHPYYGSYQSASQVATAFRKLRAIAESEQVEQTVWGGRQHYLRWRHSTWVAWNGAGLDFDSTLGYADRVGFRCGTCHEFPVYGFEDRSTLDLRERPLIVMDVTLFSRRYMDLSLGAAFDRICGLAERCREVDGTFTVLWHGRNVVTEREKTFYRQVVSEIAP